VKSHVFIFARGGSKGLPGKNIKPLLGKPLIQYSIEVALSIPEIDKIFVSTDDASIAEIASKNGAIVIDRPAALAQDCSSEWLSWQHAISWVRGVYGDFDEFISLPATSPLRSVKDVKSAMRKRVEAGADICVAITPSSQSPYFNMVKELDNNVIELVSQPDCMINHRQHAPDVFDVTTVVYVACTKFILDKSGIFDGIITSVKIPKCRAIDIDDIYDFNFAESILSKGLDSLRR
jgi:N-acylneuraminate cytidylyltransferase